MTTMTKLALLATCAGLLTACGGGSDNPAMGGGGGDGNGAETPTLEQRLAEQNKLVDEARSARRAAEKVEDLTADTAYDGIDHVTAQGRSALVHERAQAILTDYDRVMRQLGIAQDKVDALKDIMEDKSITMAEKDNAEELLGPAEYQVGEIREILGLDRDTGEPVKNNIPALRQAYLKVIEDPNMRKNAAYHEDKAADAVWEALEGFNGQPGDGLGALDRYIEEGSAFAVSEKPNGAMTFEDIVGDELDFVDIGNRRRNAVSVEGMELEKGKSYVDNSMTDFKYKGIIYLVRHKIIRNE